MAPHDSPQEPAAQAAGMAIRPAPPGPEDLVTALALQRQNTRFDIGWKDLDFKKFALWNCSIFVGIRCIIYPSALIKTRLQVQRHKDRYTGVWSAFTSILKAEGPRGLYQGFLPHQAGSIFAQFLYITSFEYIREATPSSGNFVAGGAASVISSILQVPLDVLTQRLMVQDRKLQPLTGAKRMMGEIWRHEGLQGMYRGMGVSLLLYAPYSALWWAIYSSAKAQMLQYLPDAKFDVLVHSTCGVLAAASAAFLTNPIDVIKTRLQVASSLCGEKPTISCVMRRLWQEEGVRALGKGGLARVLTVAPSSLLVIVAYEHAKKMSVKE